MSIRGWDRIFTNIQEVAREYSEAAKAGVLVEHPNSSELSQLLEAFEEEMMTTSSSLPILSLFEEHEAFSQGAPVLVSHLRIHAAIASLPGHDTVLIKFPGHDLGECLLVPERDGKLSPWEPRHDFQVL